MSVHGIPVSNRQSSGIAVSESLRSERVAHVVDVEAQFSGREARARRRLLVLARPRTGEHRFDAFARHDADTIVIGHHEIAGIHQRAGTDDAEC